MRDDVKVATPFHALAVPGFCGIGIEGSKTPANVGTLWRSAAILGADFIFTVGRRYPRQASDTIKAWRHIPLWEFEDLDDLRTPYDCRLVGVEMDARARMLGQFTHPERAVYLLGAEDHGLTKAAVERCHAVVRIPGAYSLNVAVAGTIVLYDRATKLGYEEAATSNGARAAESDMAARHTTAAARPSARIASASLKTPSVN